MRKETPAAVSAALVFFFISGAFLLFAAVLGDCFTAVCDDCFADNESEVNLPRDEKGVVISDTQRLNVPADRKIVHVAENVIKPESQTQYLTRRFDQMEQRLGLLESRLKSAEEKITTLQESQKKAAEESK